MRPCLPLRRLARRKFGLFRACHLVLPTSLALLPRQGRASGKPIPCPGIESMASGENALEMAALRETL